MKQNKKLTLNITLVLFALIPVLITSIALAVVTSSITADRLEANIREELEISAQGLLEYYQYDLLEDHDLEDGFISYETSYVDSMGGFGVDYTLCKENVRFITTIKDQSGNRINGTKVSDAVWNHVQGGESYFAEDITIVEIPYYGYYLPLYNSSGTVIGMVFAGKPSMDVQSAKTAVIITIVILSLCMVAVFAVIAILVARKIAKPMSKATAGIEELAGGNTEIMIDGSSFVKETALLLDSSKKLANVLSEAIGKIRNCTGNIVSSIDSTNEQTRVSADSISQINQSMDDLSKTTVTMAESVQDISTEIIEMGQMVDTATVSAEKLSNNAKAMDEANAEAGKCIESVVSSSDKSSQAIDTITDRIKATNNSITKINEMVKMITGIANQTNLLALNASIEAARAGEAGRGFAVVAEEIGQLAAQSNESARQIDDIVDEIAKLSTECVEESSTVKSMIDEEKSLLSITLEKFKALDTNIKASVGEISDIADITKKLDAVKNNVSTSISDLSAISEETSATNEEVSATVESVAENMRQLSNDSDSMSSEAKQLEDAVSYFK
ncbi:MAG: cache domain-containing protein [Lachnospiraceae bacterium]|nr:cache domain-containing protein [Lachnospiraceae bacterium]